MESLADTEVRFVEASPRPDDVPCCLAEMLRELGTGENGFGGTPFGTGECSLEEYLQRVVDGSDIALPVEAKVPQTVYWMLASDGIAAGMVRMRHCLNARLRERGGHIGFYIAPSYRGRGYAKQALQFALQQLRSLGEPRALLTVHQDNIPSIKTIEGCGGVLDGVAIDPDTGTEIRRYWIEL
jgi:predicted acetyltransferase